ncbi:hypothetical protein [Nocardioides psychrotolerans]|uniref:beta strand repeat-containing protein n=1 Tax=Nocardioides psychrotolerans TaxID=1005945 RepID=UPI003137B318
MNSSGIKRGLATTAITALAVTGIPFIATSANAVPLAEQIGAAQVDLVTTDSGLASLKSDGVESTVHLVAAGGSDVSQVQFRYSTDGGVTFTNIGSPVSRTSGAFSTEWAPAPAVFNLPIIVQAQALSGVGTPIDTDNNAVTVSGSADAIDIAYAPGSNVGYFNQPYAGETASARLAAVSGTTSDLTADPDLEFYEYSTGTVTNEDVAGPVAQGATTRTYSAPVDLSGYAIDGAAPLLDEALLVAVADADDAEPVVLRSQTITTVTATSPATVQQGGEADITVTVLDQFGQPVVGAQVVAEDADGDGDFLAGEANAVYTNSQGKAVFENANSSNAPGTTYDFYVNTTDTNGFQPADDFRRSVTVTSYTPTATTITATSADGAAFDTNEYTPGDLTAKVLDQNGNPLAGQTVSYTLSLAPFATTPVTPTPAPVTGSAVTNAQGVATIPFTDIGDGTYTLKTFVERDGTPGLSAGDLAAADLVFKEGESTLAFTEAPTATSASGTTDTYDATLKLADGTPLVGRAVTFTFNRAGGGNAVVAAQGNQPAGTTRTGDFTATDVTDGTGTVSVALSDPATPDQAEQGGTLDADTTTNSFGNAAEDAADLTVDFVDSTPPAGSTVTITEITGSSKPGVAQTGTATVSLPDGPDADTLSDGPVPAGTLVTLTIDDGFFTTGAEKTPSVVGADAGNLVNLGKSTTAVTNGAGQVTFQVAIERDDEFDNDGLADAVVTATSGTASDTEVVDFNSANPLNGGEVQIVKSPEGEQNGPTDPAAVGTDVFYDVFVTDQFGNRVGGQTVNLSESEEDASLSDASVLSDFDSNGDFSVSSTEGGTVTVTGTWNSPSYEYTTTTGTALPAAAEPRTDTVDVEFYEAVVTTTTIESSPEGDVPVGTSVTETVTVLDQEGNPIVGAVVEFIRNGPAAGDGDANVSRFTNAQGKAFYTFIGTEAGTADITATVTSDDGIVTLSDSVTFVADDVDPVVIEAKLFGKNLGKKDRLTVNAPARATGAVVRLYKLVAGKRVQVGKVKELNNRGDAVFTVADRNGNRITRYVAVVGRTAQTTGDTTNQRKVR